MIKRTLAYLHRWFPALLLPLFCGCHDSGAGGTPPAAFTLSVSPSGLSIPAGGGGYATVTVARRRGFSDAITLSLDGAPAGVVGSGTVATDIQTGQFSMLVAADVTPQDLGSLQVKAVAGSLSQTATFHLVVAASLPVGRISPDQVQASGGTQSGGAFENAGVASEPVPAIVTQNATATVKTRHGFDPSEH